MKYFCIENQEVLIKRMDEYKIHHKVNQLYPEQSLQLILPVRIKKKKSIEMTSCIERAEINLYDYSQIQIIQQEEAYIIFQQLLKSIINLHQINIAHRDLKPQNTFYLKEKDGYYLILESHQNIKMGTQYFLKTNIQTNIKQGKCKQNLLQNDLYALVVSMIMIQKQHYIKDIQQEITLFNNELYAQIIQIDKLEELIVLNQTLQLKQNNYKLKGDILFEKKMNQTEQISNQKMVYSSWLYLFTHFNKIQSHTQLIPQILNLIKQNFQNILSLKSLRDKLLEIQYFFDIHINISPPKFWMKYIHNFSTEYKQFCIKTLFLQGYSEKTIFFATEFLKNNYSQEVHLILIDSYSRALMFQQAEQQFKIFIEGFLFDYLDSDLQAKFFQYLLYYQDKSPNLKIYMDFNIEEQLIQRKNIKRPDIINQLDEAYQQYQYQNKDIIVDNLLYNFINDKYFNILQLEYLMIIMEQVIIQYPVDILLEVCKRLNLISCSSYDINRKISNCYEIAEILILLNTRKEFKNHLKFYKQKMFQSESWQQTLSIQISFLIIQIEKFIFQQSASKGKIQIFIKRLFIVLQEIQFINFYCYKVVIINCLFHFLKMIQQYSIPSQSKQLLYIIKRSIDFAFITDFQQIDINFFRLGHIQAQLILLELRNIKRCQMIVSQYHQFLDYKATRVRVEKQQDDINFFVKPSIRGILSIERSNSKRVKQMVSSEFLYNRFFR